MELPRATERLLSLASSLRYGKFREAEGEFLLEGDRIVRDALEHLARIEHLIVRDDSMEKFADVIARCDAEGIPVSKASARQFARITDTRQPQGIAAVAPLPQVAREGALARVDGRETVVALHGIADPGNLGTIIRAMDWFGAPLLLLSSGSVDPWSPKVVRSAMGSVFRVSILRYETENDLLRLAAAADRSIVAAVADGGMPLPDVASPLRPLMLFGSEAHGVPTVLSEAAALRVTIPGVGTAESLNLAMSASIMLYTMSSAAKQV